MEFDWKLLRFHLFNALDQVKVDEIYLIERENNIINLCLVVEEMDKIRPLTKMNIIDRLIEKNNPEIYQQYLFTYEIWDKKTWGQQLVSRMLYRQKLIKA